MEQTLRVTERETREIDQLVTLELRRQGRGVEPEFVERDHSTLNHPDPGRDIEHVVVKAFHPKHRTFELIETAMAEMLGHVADYQRKAEGDTDSDAILTKTNYRLDWWQVVQTGYYFHPWITWIPFLRFPEYGWELVGDEEQLRQLLVSQTDDNLILGLCVSLFQKD